MPLCPSHSSFYAHPLGPLNTNAHCPATIWFPLLECTHSLDSCIFPITHSLFSGTPWPAWTCHFGDMCRDEHGHERGRRTVAGDSCFSHTHALLQCTCAVSWLRIQGMWASPFLLVPRDSQGHNQPCPCRLLVLLGSITGLVTAQVLRVPLTT